MNEEKLQQRNKDLCQVIDQYSSMLYRICIVMLKNEEDTKDVLQETFIKYMNKYPQFESEEGRKAWLIKVSQNKCLDYLRFRKRHDYMNLNELLEVVSEKTSNEDWRLLLELKPKYKSIILLYYVEGYSAKEIANILGISESAVKKRLQRGREMLKNMIIEE